MQGGTALVLHMCEHDARPGLHRRCRLCLRPRYEIPLVDRQAYALHNRGTRHTAAHGCGTTAVVCLCSMSVTNGLVSAQVASTPQPRFMSGTASPKQPGASITTTPKWRSPDLWYRSAGWKMTTPMVDCPHCVSSSTQACLARIPSTSQITTRRSRYAVRATP